MTYQAIAVRMGISKESVKELMHRAIVRISQEMGGDR
ncbi:sigma factor-like helix-turn-helix DNA-binding protein [Sphingomonas sp.]